MGRETCHIFLNLGVFLIAILLPAKTLALFRAIIDIIREYIILITFSKVKNLVQ